MAVAHQIKVCPTCKGEYAGGELFCPVDATRLLTSSQLGSARRDPNDPLIGALLAQRYEIIRLIGEGGMGLVYEGVHKDIDKKVAIKVLRDDLSRRPDVVARFRQEAKSASRIGHEHIVDVSDFGETVFGSSYFVMEYLAGQDLADVLANQAIIDPERVVQIAVQCCEALGSTHRKRIVHRDMKPENVFLTERDGIKDFVKIVDFGIAMMSDIETEGAPGRKLTKTGMIFGTPEYMSPEQAAGKELDHRVDIYAMGVIMFECLAGRVPFVGDTFMGILTKHLFDEPPRIRDINPASEVNLQLETVIRKAMAKDPTERYETMDELAEAAECALEGKLTEATVSISPVWPTASEEVEATFIRRGHWGKWLALAALVGTGIFAATQWWVPAAEDGAAAQETDPAPPAVVSPAGPPVQGDVGPVAVRVETDREGASVTFGDGSPACAATPCTIEVARGEPFSLKAADGRFVGESGEIIPERPVIVSISMKGKASRARTRAARPGPSARQSPKKARPKRVGDLKVPDFAR